MANAAATLVGQNLGAGQPDRAETSVWRAALCNVAFLTLVGIVFYTQAYPIVGLFDRDPGVMAIAVPCLRVFCVAYIFMAYGMVIGQALNGAGDTRTPTLINIVCFWLVEIPLAYVLANLFGWGPSGVFWSVVISQSLLAILVILVFRRGRWKVMQV